MSPIKYSPVKLACKMNLFGDENKKGNVVVSKHEVEVSLNNNYF